MTSGFNPSPTCSWLWWSYECVNLVGLKCAYEKGDGNFVALPENVGGMVALLGNIFTIA